MPKTRRQFARILNSIFDVMRLVRSIQKCMHFNLKSRISANKSRYVGINGQVKEKISTKVLKFQQPLLIISLLLLSSCGFHLRGIADIPDWLTNIAITVENGSRELEPLLNAQLESYHVKISPSKTKAQYWLIIENDSFQKQITNVSASTTPRQYLLLYTVQFSLIKNKGESLLSSNTVSVTRQFTLNNDRILGSDYEEMTFKREMEREAVSLIISRLSTAHQNTNYAH